MAKKQMIILYVADQKRSTAFYEAVLGKKPILEVPGMTEFELTDNFLLGLMPESGIAKILGDKITSPEKGNGMPRCELYLIVQEPANSLTGAIDAGAKFISAAAVRTWGDEVSYCADPDGHIIAFAK
jgi:catechol 2,3-dioxygenase-like lactoylglutathione lyase family enzyme